MNLDFLDNKYFFAVFSILMLMYATQIRQPLPQFMMDLFQNPIFRVAILFLILVRGYKDIQFSLIVSVAFILIMNIVNEQLFKESFGDTTQNIDTECFIIKQKIDDIDACLKQTNLLDCSNETGINKETCEKNNDDIIGLKATLGHKKYKIFENLDNKCPDIDFGNSNPPSNNLVCKDI